MDYTLNTFVKAHHNIPMYVKLSILEDISRGINYLCALNPPVVIRYLDTSCVLMNKNLTAKLCVNYHCMKVLKANSKSPSNATSVKLDKEQLMPEEVLSFGLMICYVVNQHWPMPELSDFGMHRIVRDSFQSDIREQWIDQISDQQLQKLEISCLEYNQRKRPSISRVCEVLTTIIGTQN